MRGSGGVLAGERASRFQPDSQRYPKVATDADGDFVVIWHSNNGWLELRHLRPALRPCAELHTFALGDADEHANAVSNSHADSNSHFDADSNADSDLRRRLRVGRHNGLVRHGALAAWARAHFFVVGVQHSGHKTTACGEAAVRIREPARQSAHVAEGHHPRRGGADKQVTLLARHRAKRCCARIDEGSQRALLAPRASYSTSAAQISGLPGRF